MRSKNSIDTDSFDEKFDAGEDITPWLDTSHIEPLVTEQEATESVQKKLSDKTSSKDGHNLRSSN